MKMLVTTSLQQADGNAPKPCRRSCCFVTTQHLKLQTTTKRPHFFGAGTVSSTEPVAWGNWLQCCVVYVCGAGKQSLVTSLPLLLQIKVTLSLDGCLCTSKSDGRALGSCSAPAGVTLSHRQTYHHSPQTSLTCHFYYRTYHFRCYFSHYRSPVWNLANNWKETASDESGNGGSLHPGWWISHSSLTDTPRVIGRPGLL